jgi:hypothetical protein
MSKIQFHCDFKLALSPLSLEHFIYSKNDSELHRILKGSSLYIVCKRPILLFQKIKIKQDILVFEIINFKTNEKVDVELPLYQKEVIISRNIDYKIDLESDFINHNGSDSAITLFESIFIKDKKDNLIKWYTPDAILEQKFSKKLSCEIKGDYSELLEFEVLYVGEAVIQDIWKRISKHENIQRILALEEAATLGVKPSKEIHVLFFEIHKTSDVRSVSLQHSKDFESRVIPNDNYIYYDAEKAFINVLLPKYNQRTYKKYPQSTNGLFNEDYPRWSFSIDAPIKLLYKDGEINGDKDIIYVDKKGAYILSS